MLTVILVAVIGALGTVFAAYLVSRTNKQDRILNQIEVNVNSRLDALLTQAGLDNLELNKLRARPKNTRHDDVRDDPPTGQGRSPTGRVVVYRYNKTPAPGYQGRGFVVLERTRTTPNRL